MDAATAPPPTKQARIDKEFIVTHNGTFHCDEALACSMLKMLPRFEEMEVVRTRDAQIIDQAVIAVDVGGKYDPEKMRYDHHQRGFEATFDEKHSTKLSSAGLVYKHYGKEVVQRVAGLDGRNLDLVYNKVYDCFIEELDGLDNGIDPFDGRARYSVNTTLGNRVARLNPNWNEPKANEWDGFCKAMEMTQEEFVAAVHYYAKVWLPARDLVEQAVVESKENEFGGQVIVLKQHCPWLSHIFAVEMDLGIEGRSKYVLFADQAGAWRIQCVPTAAGSFQNRLSLPEPWRGVRDEALSELTGIPDCIFVHANGFIGGTKTYEGVVAMARAALLAGNTESA